MEHVTRVDILGERQQSASNLRHNQIFFCFLPNNNAFASQEQENSIRLTKTWLSPTEDPRTLSTFICNQGPTKYSRQLYYQEAPKRTPKTPNMDYMIQEKASPASFMLEKGGPNRGVPPAIPARQHVLLEARTMQGKDHCGD